MLFARLPALEVIGRLNRTSVTIGLTTLAVSLVLGILEARAVWPSLADPKIVWALVTVFVYGLLLWMERRGWEGPRVAILSIVGFGVVMFSYTVVNVLPQRGRTASDERRGRSPAAAARLELPDRRARGAGARGVRGRRPAGGARRGSAARGS